MSRQETELWISAYDTFSMGLKCSVFLAARFSERSNVAPSLFAFRGDEIREIVGGGEE